MKLLIVEDELRMANRARHRVHDPREMKVRKFALPRSEIEYL
jgi:hypothetical protein